MPDTLYNKPKRSTELQGDINKYFQDKDRDAWLKKNEQVLRQSGYSVGRKPNNGGFNNQAVERLFRNSMYRKTFGTENYDKQTPEERDSAYAETQYAKLNPLATRIDNAALRLYNKSQEAPKPVIPTTDSTSTEVPIVELDTSRLLVNPNIALDTYSGVQAETAAKETIFTRDQKAQHRYDNDTEGTLYNIDEKKIKQYMPLVNGAYKEFLEGNDKYIKDSDIDWETIVPIIANYLDEGNEQDAVGYINNYINDVMAKNQSTLEKVARYGKRFGTTAVTTGLATFGLITGPFEALTKLAWDAIDPNKSVELSQILATALYDNSLVRLADKAQDYVRERNPIYTNIVTSNPLEELGKVLAENPESMGFTASMVVPTGAVSGLAKLSTKAPKLLGRVTGRTAASKKAIADIDKVLSDAQNVNKAALQNTGMDATYKALREGKTLAKAQEEARAAQIEALTDIYMRGKTNNRQLLVASISESQIEALGAKKASMDQYDEVLDKQTEELIREAVKGDIDLGDLSYTDRDYIRAYENLVNNGYLENVYQQLKQSENAEGYSDEQIMEAAYNYVGEEAMKRAQIKNYIDSNREEFEAKKLRNANLAGMLTFAQDLALLMLTESLGGFTTKLPTYQTVNSLSLETKGLKGIWNRMRSSASPQSLLNSRIGFDETGKAVKKVTAKSMGQALGKVGGTLAIENAQEIGQEFITSGAEGTAHHNAEQFVLSHITGPGNDTMQEQYQWYMPFRHIGFNRTFKDYQDIIKATSVTMGLGTPSISKYIVRRNENLSRRDYESNAAYSLRWAEKYLPVNSPTLQNIAQVANMSTEARTFVEVYNKLYDKSRAYSGFASSSLNYAARIEDAAVRGEQISYDNNIFAAQTAEALFISQLTGANRDAKVAYFQAMADINKKRENETDEEFNARRANTLQAFRDKVSFNSLKNLSDEDLSAIIEKRGDDMINRIESVGNKVNQLYEQYNNSLPWEALYGMVFGQENTDHIKSLLNGYESKIESVLPHIVNTEITAQDETIKDNKGNEKRVKIYNQTELLMADAVTRSDIMENATGKQAEIVQDLMSQLQQLYTNSTTDTLLDEKFFNDYATSAREYQNSIKELRDIINNPQKFIDRIRNKKYRKIADDIFKDFQSIAQDSDRTQREKLLDIKDLLDMSSVLNKRQYENLVKAIMSLGSKESGLFFAAQMFSDENGKALEDAYNDVINNLRKLKETNPELYEQHYKEDDYKALVEKIRGQSAYGFTDENLEANNNFSDSELEMLNDLRNAHKARLTVNPNSERIDITEDEETTEDEEPAPNTEEVRARAVEDYKTFLRLQLAEQKGKLTEESYNELEKIINDILNQQFEKEEDITTALGKVALKSEGIIKSVIKTIMSNAVKGKNSRHDSHALSRGKLSLASPTFFLNNHPDGNFAWFFRKYKIVELLKTGKIKEGVKVYAMWDDEFNNKTRETLGSMPFTENQIGLVALVEGSFDGFESVTIGDKTYTRIGLFRAYGEGTHNTSDIVSRMVQSITGHPIDSSNDEIPSKGQVIITQDNKPLSFTIQHLNESELATSSSQNNVQDLSIERETNEENLLNPNNQESKEDIATRAREWFLDHIQVSKDNSGRPIIQIKIPRHNKQGYSLIPILVKNITQTKWFDSTVGEILQNEERREELLATVSGVPRFVEAGDILAKFMSQEKKYINDFIKKANKLQSRLSKGRIRESTYNNEYSKLVEELNDNCDKLLNEKYGRSLYNRLSLPSFYKYFVKPEVTTDTESGEPVFTFSLGVKSTLPGVTNEYTFITYNAPTEDGFVEELSNKDIADALYNLIYDESGSPRMSTENTEFIKWQINFGDIKNKDIASRAREMVEELYDMNALYALTESFISDQLDIDILPDNINIAQEEINTKPLPPDNPPDNPPSNPPKAKKTRTEEIKEALNLAPSSDLSEEFRQKYPSAKYGLENVEIGGIDIPVITLTELGELRIITDNELSEGQRLALYDNFEKGGIHKDEIFFVYTETGNKGGTEGKLEPKGPQDGGLTRDIYTGGNEGAEGILGSKGISTPKQLATELTKYGVREELIKAGLISSKGEMVEYLEKLKDNPKFGSLEKIMDSFIREYDADTEEFVASLHCV